MWGPRKLVLILALVALATGGAVSADDNFCQGCKSLISFSRQFNASNQRTEFRELFKNFCELYYPAGTDYQQGPCPVFVSGLFYVLDHTDAVQHCDQIGACTSETKPASQPSDDIYEYLQTSNNNNNAIKPLSVSKRGDNVVCEFCEQAVVQVKNMLKDPAIIDQMKRQLDAFCSYLVVIDQDKECRRLIDCYIDQAIEFVQAIDPKQYCQAIAVCPRPEAERLRLQARKQFTRERLAALPSLADFRNFGIETSVKIGGEKTVADLARSSPPTCMLCKTVVKELFHFLRNNRTEENIMRGLERICSMVYRPGDKRDHCDMLVKSYTRELVQLMIDETDPQLICMLLDQCGWAHESGSHEALALQPLLLAPPTPVPSTNAGIAELISALSGTTLDPQSAETCLECKLFVRYLRKSLDKQRTQEEMRKWLQANLCAELPNKDLVQLCSSTIDKEMSVLVQAIRGALEPKTACREMGVCKSRPHIEVFTLANSVLRSRPTLPSPEERALETKRKISNRPREMQAQLCDQCVEIVAQIDDYLSSHPIDQDVTMIVDKVCNKLPEGSARGECTFIVKTFGAEIVQAVSTMENPRQLCSKIFLCSANNNNKARPDGAKRRKYSASYNEQTR